MEKLSNVRKNKGKKANENEELVKKQEEKLTVLSKHARKLIDIDNKEFPPN